MGEFWEDGEGDGFFCGGFGIGEVSGLEAIFCEAGLEVEWDGVIHGVSYALCV